MTNCKRSVAANMWIASGVLLALTLGFWAFREVPAIRREMRIMKM